MSKLELPSIEPSNTFFRSISPMFFWRHKKESLFYLMATGGSVLATLAGASFLSDYPIKVVREDANPALAPGMPTPVIPQPVDVNMINPMTGRKIDAQNPLQNPDGSYIQVPIKHIVQPNILNRESGRTYVYYPKTVELPLSSFPAGWPEDQAALIIPGPALSPDYNLWAIPKK